jgi:hypothetical protein
VVELHRPTHHEFTSSSISNITMSPSFLHYSSALKTGLVATTSMDTFLDSILGLAM